VTGRDRAGCLAHPGGNAAGVGRHRRLRPATPFVLQVVDAFANSSTATVNVTKQAAAVSSAGPQAKSVGCGSTGGPALPLLGIAGLVLLGWRSLGVRRHPMG